VKDKTVEKLTQGEASLLVKDGTINLEELEKSQVTRQQLFAMLREKKVQNLANVERAYLEACGLFNVFQTDEAKAGLPILPPSDAGILNAQRELDSDTRACCSCGHVQQVKNKDTACEICNAKEWTRAYLVK